MSNNNSFYIDVDNPLVENENENINIDTNLPGTSIITNDIPSVSNDEINFLNRVSLNGMDDLNNIISDLETADIHSTPIPSVKNSPQPSEHNSPVPSVKNSPVPSVHNSPVPSEHNSPVQSVHNSPVHSIHGTPIPSVNNSPRPTVHNTPQPSVHNTPQPSVHNTPQPSVHNTPQPSVHNTPQPSVRNTPQPSVHNTPQPSVRNTPQPSVHNTPQLSVHNTPQPSVHNTPKPSVHNTPQPSVHNTPQPSVHNTPRPSVSSVHNSRLPINQNSRPISAQNSQKASREQSIQNSPNKPQVSKSSSRNISRMPSLNLSKIELIHNESPISSVRNSRIDSKMSNSLKEVLRSEVLLAKLNTNESLKNAGIEKEHSKREDIETRLNNLNKERMEYDEINMDNIKLDYKEKVNNEEEINEIPKANVFNNMTNYFNEKLKISDKTIEETDEDIKREAAEAQVYNNDVPITFDTHRKRRVDRQLLANDLSSELPITLRYNENVHVDNELEVENYTDEWSLWVEDGLDKLDELILLLDDLEDKYKSSSRRNRYTANTIQFLNLLLGSGIVYVQSSTTNAELIRDWNTVAGGLSTISTMIYNYFGFAKKSSHYAAISSNIYKLNCWVKSKLVLPVDKRFSPFDIYIISTKALQVILEEAQQKKQDSK